MPLGGGALAAAAVEIRQDGGLVPVHGCTEWKHDPQTLFLLASLPWPKKQHKCECDIFSAEMFQTENIKLSIGSGDVWMYCGFTLTKEETGKVAKSEEAFAPG